MRRGRHPTPKRLTQRPHWRRRITGLLSVLILVGAVGCLHDATVGPLYSDAPTPPPGSARVFLYRIDPHHSYSIVEIRFDKDSPLQILDEEYITLELSEGTHEIDFRLRRRFGWPSGTWRNQRIRARNGETIYFEIAVGMTEGPTPGIRNLEIAGRPTGTAGETVTIRARDESEALDLIRMTHLHVP